MNGWQVAISVAGGFALGLFYFGGLWWTVRRLPRVRQPMLWSLGSFWVRAALCMAGLYAVMAGDWKRLLLAMAGFFCAKLFMVYITKPQRAPMTARMEDG